MNGAHRRGGETGGIGGGVAASWRRA